MSGVSPVMCRPILGHSGRESGVQDSYTLMPSSACPEAPGPPAVHSAVRDAVLPFEGQELKVQEPYTLKPHLLCPRPAVAPVVHHAVRDAVLTHDGKELVVARH